MYQWYDWQSKKPVKGMPKFEQWTVAVQTMLDSNAQMVVTDRPNKSVKAAVINDETNELYVLLEVSG